MGGYPQLGRSWCSSTSHVVPVLCRGSHRVSPLLTARIRKLRHHARERVVVDPMSAAQQQDPVGVRDTAVAVERNTQPQSADLQSRVG